MLCKAQPGIPSAVDLIVLCLAFGVRSFGRAKRFWEQLEGHFRGRARRDIVAG